MRSKPRSQEELNLGRLSADVNSSSKADEATDPMKTMIESKTVRSTAAVPHAEQVETASEQPLFENQLSRTRTAVRTADVRVMTSKSDGSRTQPTHHGGVLGFVSYRHTSRVQRVHQKPLHNKKELAL